MGYPPMRRPITGTYTMVEKSMGGRKAGMVR